MIIVSLVLFIGVCVAFCYLFYKILEINKDIDTLYNNYSQFIENSFKTNLSERRSILK